MLCQFVWKTQQQEEKDRATARDDDAKNDNVDADDDDKKKEEKKDTGDGGTGEVADADATEPTDGDDADAGDAMGGDNEGEPKAEKENEELVVAVGQDQEAKEQEAAAAAAAASAYDDYRRRYCLNYVRAFFNKHLDDSWFRARYSPACRKRVAALERPRAVSEAKAIRQAVDESLRLKADTNDEEVPSFVQQARLGGGVKQSSSLSSFSSTPRKRRLSSGDLDDPSTTTKSSSTPDPLLRGKNRHTTPLPTAHMISSTSNALYVHEIPPHVTDDQLVVALMEHCTIPADQRGDASTSALKVYSSTPSTSLPSLSSSDNRKRIFLQRSAFVVCPVPSVQQDILRNLKKTAGDDTAIVSKQHVPRKADEDESASNQRLPLDVECSDPYGRLEYDADGKGGAPADGLAVPPRKTVVLVSAPLPPEKLQIVKVLSAALSSKERIPRDKEAACLIARALDVAKQIPRDCRLDDVLEQLFPNAQAPMEPSVVEDMLDVSIAYLRRVHLFSLYNGCTMADSVADVLAGKHAVSTIHVRLENADEILQAAKDDAAATTPAPTTMETQDADKNDSTEAAAEAEGTKDLLVQRLDDSIAKALENCNVWVNSGNYANDDDNNDNPNVAAIQEAELETEDTWLENHSSLDDDGRARCRFHFCHKLFKDSSFLHKHLLKKHVEYLRAEQGKSHDEYMMKAWDAESNRPVPDVLVDCGSMFGLVAAVVAGQVPDAEDPEPALWSKEEERRKNQVVVRQREQEMRQQRQQQRQHEFSNDDHQNNRGGLSSSGALGSNRSGPNTSGGGGGGGGGGFVDVDDMKEEKMEVSFDNVEIPAVALKKKKKKRKLL
jgi:hypothetical protein